MVLDVKTYDFDCSTLDIESVMGCANVIGSQIRADFHSQRFLSFCRGLKYSACNFRDTFLGSLSDYKTNTNRSLVILVHGLFQSSSSFFRLESQLRDGGFDSACVDYDFRAPFNENCSFVADRIGKIIDRDTKNVVLLGHSTGADILRHNAVTGNINSGIAGIILSAPILNGKAVNRLFGKLEAYADPANREGLRNTLLFNRGLKMPCITVLALQDSFIPLESSLDLHGKNVVLNGYGHISGTGCCREFNRLYSELAQSFLSVA